MPQVEGETDSNHLTHTAIMSDRGWGSRRNVAPYLGVTIVVVIGFWGILLPALLAFPESPFESVLVISSLLALVVSLLWKLTPASELPSAIYSWVLNRKPKEDALQGYEPLTKRTKRLKTGAQAPPSVDDLRDIKQSSNNWVPTGNQPPKRVARSRRLGTNDRMPGAETEEP